MLRTLPLTVCFYPHAPGGARHPNRLSIQLRWRVSIRTPRAGRDCSGSEKPSTIVLFLSARPGRGATGISRLAAIHKTCFYPHAPGGARPVSTSRCRRLPMFLSARPGRGATLTVTLTDAPSTLFLSARPGRGATTSGVSVSNGTGGFYPHAPGGARLGSNYVARVAKEFLSALPGRGATWLHYHNSYTAIVSIRTPRAGRDAVLLFVDVAGVVSIRTPRAGRDSPSPLVERSASVSIRTPRAGRDLKGTVYKQVLIAVSIRTPRAGRDRVTGQDSTLFILFLSARPGRGATPFGLTLTT